MSMVVKVYGSGTEWGWYLLEPGLDGKLLCYTPVLYPSREAAQLGFDDLMNKFRGDVTVLHESEVLAEYDSEGAHG